MAIHALLAVLALAPQAAQIPYEKAGKELLELASRGKGKAAAQRAEIRARLEPLHERVRLGAFELWVPRRGLTEKLGNENGPDAGDAQAFAADLVALQGEWISRASNVEADMAKARKANDVMARYVESLSGARIPEPRADVVAARELLETHFYRRASGASEYSQVLMLAPTRAHYVGVIGAASILDAGQRDRLRVDSNRRTSSASLCPGASVIAMTDSPEEAVDDPLKDTPVETEAGMQNFVHTAAHVLNMAMNPTAPRWWDEGLAICDTIAVRRADETICTGFADTHPGANLAASSSVLGVFLWVTRHKSPFRDTFSPAFFDAPLRAAWSREGFQVFDLDTVTPAFRVTPPLLGDRMGAPDVVLRGPKGARKGFAELYRAYCTAFVHWIDVQRPSGERSLLDDLCFELSKYVYEIGADDVPLYQLVVRVTGKSIGASQDAEKDLEAAFVAHLSR